MKNHPLLAENESKRLNFRLPLLICFALYLTWQMGMIYFSGQTLSIDGKTPLPINIDNLTLLIAIGYILSILVMVFVPRIIVWLERLTACIAFLSALALFIPIGPSALSIFYYVQCFCCFFMIGFESAIIINLLSERTTLTHLLVAYPLAQVIIAILQNDIFSMPFSVFRIFAIVALACMLIFFFKLPVTVWPKYVRKEDNLIAPKSFIAGIFLLIALSCFATLFGNTVAESIRHGVSFLYLSSAICGVIVYLLWKRFNITPLHCGKGLASLTALGFITAITAQFVPLLSLVSCILIGAGMACCWLVPFYALLIFKRYPSRYVVPSIIGIAFITVLIHASILEVFRSNLTLLYIVYLAIAVIMVIIYLILEPYLLYSFRGRTLQDIIGVVAEEPDESRPDPELTPIEKTVIEKPAPPLDKSLHEQRMTFLLKHALTPLTQREYELTDCIMRGLRRSEIVQQMNIKPSTINDYRKTIYNKFDIHSRQELFKLAETLDREWPDEDT